MGPINAYERGQAPLYIHRTGTEQVTAFEAFSHSPDGMPPAWPNRTSPSLRISSLIFYAHLVLGVFAEVGNGCAIYYSNDNGVCPFVQGTGLKPSACIRGQLTVSAWLWLLLFTWYGFDQSTRDESLQILLPGFIVIEVLHSTSLGCL